MWYIKLTGNESILENLARKYVSNELRIEKSLDGYFLSSDKINTCCDDKSVYECGERIIEFINSLIQLVSYLDDAIKSDGYYRQSSIDSGKERKFYGIYSATLPLRVTVFSNDIPPSSYFSLFEDERVNYVLFLLETNNESWFSLYSIYETIENDGQFKISSCSARAIKDKLKEINKLGFCQTANWHRHSRYGSTAEPKKPMALPSAKSLIRELVKQWLNWKSNINSSDFCPETPN